MLMYLPYNHKISWLLQERVFTVKISFAHFLQGRQRGACVKGYSLIFCLVTALFLLVGGCGKVQIPGQKADKSYSRKVLKILRSCDIQTSRRLKATNLALFSSAFPKMHCSELDKHAPDLVNYGGVLIGRLMPGDLNHMDRMMANGIIAECPVCRLDGRESCFTCRGTGMCPRCKGTGKLNGQAGEESKIFSSEDADGESGSKLSFTPAARCPIKCTVCKGTGHMTKSCRKCGGKKYLLSKKKLRVVYIEQYKMVEAIVKSQAGL